MPQRAIIPISYYHIFNRGAAGRTIFPRRPNWSFFLERLTRYLTPDLADIVAYCLMPNHYHLLLFIKDESFGHRAMQPLGVSYAKAINKQENWQGHLFQGPYQTRRVDAESYLLTLARYIYLNPVTAGLVDRPEAWPYSSYATAVGLRTETIAQPGVLHELCGGPDALRQYVEDDSHADEKWLRSFWQQA